MAVASLAMQITDYQDAACAQIYGGAGYSSLGTNEQATINRLILRAERTCFLHPPVDPPYVWSCLRDPGLLTLWTDVAVDSTVTVTAATTTVTASAASFFPTMVGLSIVITGDATYTISAYTSSTIITIDSSSSASGATFSITGDGVYRLPTTFESPATPSLVWIDNIWAERPQLIDADEVRSMRSRDSSTGYPRFAAIRWVASDGTAGQNQELIIYPRAAADYAVALPYMVQPVGMSTANPYPLGGPEMADVLLSFVVAICEEERDGQRGDRWAEAIAKVNNAVKRDRTRHHNFIAGFMRRDSRDYPLALNVKTLIQTGTYP